MCSIVTVLVVTLSSLSQSLSLTRLLTASDSNQLFAKDLDEAQGEVSSDGSEEWLEPNHEYVVTRALKNDGVMESSRTQFEMRCCVV